ncbi:hypothetical protein F5B20DRAFT_532267 [Whalleya microplaca]|nr:hypothetical protein F5B20DRAFT_532267 [Whalleya microplaca]
MNPTNQQRDSADSPAQDRQSQQPGSSNANPQNPHRINIQTLSIGGLYIVVNSRGLQRRPSQTDEQYAAALRNRGTIEHEPYSYWDLYFHVGENRGVRYLIRASIPTTFEIVNPYVHGILEDPRALGLVQINQIPRGYMRNVTRIGDVTNRLWRFCRDSMHCLNATRQLNSRTWCLMVAMRLWDDEVNAATASAQGGSIDSLLRGRLQPLIQNWVRLIARDIAPQRQLAPVVLWRQNECPWCIFYPDLCELHNIHRDRHH